MKNKNIWIYIFSAFTFSLPLSAQEIDCEDWLPLQCEAVFPQYIQSVLTEAICVQWGGECDLTRPIFREGTVGIGTANDETGFSLNVTDGIIATNLKVCETSETWCDYVFEEGYELMNLKDVEKYIKENGHLHNTPSGKEIEEEGRFDLGEVALNHQEKIEEIFLHLIEMKKTADELRVRLNEAKKENTRLKAETASF